MQNLPINNNLLSEIDILDHDIKKIISKIPNFSQLILKLNEYDLQILENFKPYEIKNLLFILDYYYHIRGESLIKDNIYDEIIKKYPNYVTNLFENKIILPCSMPGLKKYYPEHSKQIFKILDTFASNNIIISSKLDGVSCLVYKKKNKINLYTKGTNEEGRDITYILDYISFNKENLNCTKNLILRGELIIKKEYYKIFNVNTSLRSQVVKLIHQKEIDKNLLKYVDLVVYEIKEPKYSFKTQFYSLTEKYELNVVKNICIDYLSVPNIIKYLLEIYQDFLQKEKYDIDGLVVSEANIIHDTLDNSEYQFAFKNNTIFGISEIINIQWKMSKDSKCIPLLYIKPIMLGKITVTKVSGYNASFIINNKIGIGAKIKIKYSGNVIPTIDSIILASDNIPLPDQPTLWDENKIHLITTDIYNIETMSKQIEKYYIIFKIKNFGSQTIKKILIRTSCEYHITSIFQYIDTLKNWNQSEKILGSKKDIELYQSLRIFKFKPISIISLLLATNKFNLIDEIKLTKIFLDNKLLIDIITLKESINVLTEEKLLSIPNIGSKTATSFMIGLKYFIDLKDKFDLYFNINYNIILEDKLLKIVLTNVNTNQKTYINYYREYFIEYLNVTKSNPIDYVVTSNLEDTYTEKMNKAIKYNIPIITLNEFIEKIKALKNNI